MNCGHLSVEMPWSSPFNAIHFGGNLLLRTVKASYKAFWKTRESPSFYRHAKANPLGRIVWVVGIR